jgi:predicted nucleic acid-binding protein
MPLALLDTTVLSNFAQVQRADLVQQALGPEAATTPLVLAELRAGEALGHIPALNWTWLTVLEPSVEEHALAEQFALQLDPGESECLAVAASRGGRFLSDDLAARRMARQRGVPLSGTVGLLLLLVTQQIVTIDEADQLLEQIINHGYRSPVSSLDELLG